MERIRVKVLLVLGPLKGNKHMSKLNTKFSISDKMNEVVQKIKAMILTSVNLVQILSLRSVPKNRPAYAEISLQTRNGQRVKSD